MKWFIFLLVIFSSTLFAQSNRTFSIDKNNQSGYNIYNSSGELLYEFTKLNTDSATLKNLDQVFSKATLDKNGKQPIAVINLQEKGFDWVNLLIAVVGILGTLSAGLLTNRQNNKNQFEHYKRTFKDEEIDKWILELKNNISSFISLVNQLDTSINELHIKLNSRKNLSLDDAKKIVDFVHSMELIELNSNILLNNSDAQEKSLFKKLNDNILNILETVSLLTNKNHLIETMHELERRISAISENMMLKEELKNKEGEFEEKGKKYETNRSDFGKIKNEIIGLVKIVIKNKELEKSFYKEI